MNKKRKAFRSEFVVLALLAVLAGCGTVDYTAMREDQAVAIGARLEAKTAERVSSDRPLTLEDCIGIAMENNLDVRLKDLEVRLAKLDRQAAFGNFLPLVELNSSYSVSDPVQKIKAGGTYIQMSDRDYTYAGFSAQQPIFVPQAWLLYSMRRKGEDISDLLRQRTQQLIALQVTGEYFACLSGMESEDYLRQAVEEAETLLKETRAFEREGLATPAQRMQVETLLLYRRNALADNERNLRQAKADLLETMGLYPFAEFDLAVQTPYSTEERELADLVLEALLNRLELHVADRNIEIQKDETRMAIADFLPNLFGVGSLTYNSDSFLKYSSVWAGGVAGVLTVFDGFQNIQHYRAAREGEEEGFLKREQLCLTMMLEVLKARLQADRAEDQLALARQNLAALELREKEIQARWREGLIRLSEYLNVSTQRDEAKAQLLLARYRQQVALATLADVTGKKQEES